jgi:hypothetical protein
MVRKGWRNESARHSLAARGVKTPHKSITYQRITKLRRQAKDGKEVIIFRKWRDTGDVIAVFPEWPSALHFGEVNSYEHKYQTGGVDYSFVMERTVPAKPAEYKELLEELIAKDYFDGRDFVIREKASYDMMKTAYEKQRKEWES